MISDLRCWGGILIVITRVSIIIVIAVTVVAIKYHNAFQQIWSVVISTKTHFHLLVDAEGERARKVLGIALTQGKSQLFSSFFIFIFVNVIFIFIPHFGNFPIVVIFLNWASLLIAENLFVFKKGKSQFSKELAQTCNKCSGWLFW